MRIGLLLLNMGGPERLEDVRPFLFRLFRDPDILPLPRWLRWLAWPLALLISTFRAPKSRRAYASIGGGTPLVRNDKAVARALGARLADLGVVKSTVAMRYWHPLTDAALDVLEFAGVERIVAIPMYPQYSTTTTMSSFRELRRRLAARRRRWAPTLDVVVDYADDPGYLGCVRRRLEATIADLPTDRGRTAILCSAHSIPVDRVREDGDPYPSQIEASVRAITAGLPADLEVALAYQSKVGPVEWVGPAIGDEIVRLAKDGVRSLVVVPVSFTSEHVETREELDQVYREVAEKAGIVHWRRVPTVATDDDFLDALAAVARRAIAGDVGSTTCRRGLGKGCICQGDTAQ